MVHGKVTLSSGLEADYYIDLRRDHPRRRGRAAGRPGAARPRPPSSTSTAVGGLTLGADPVATSMLHAAAARGQRLDAFVVRKAAKAHGMQRRVEGPDIKGRRVLVVEDTSTTGGSPLTAVEAVREAGARGRGAWRRSSTGRRAPPRRSSRAPGVPYLFAYSNERPRPGLSPAGTWRSPGAAPFHVKRGRADVATGRRGPGAESGKMRATMTSPPGQGQASHTRTSQGADRCPSQPPRSTPRCSTGRRQASSPTRPST